MRHMLLTTRCTAVGGTLMLIALVVMVSDVMVGPGLARDVMRALGAQLAALGGSAWYTRRAARVSATASTTDRSPLRGSNPK